MGGKNSRWPHIGLCGAPSKLLTKELQKTHIIRAYAEITLAFTTSFVGLDFTFATSSEISN